MQITMQDITKKRNASSINHSHSQFNINEMKLYTKDGKFIENNALHVLNHWQDFSEDTNIAFNKALDVFIEVCENCPESVARSMCDMLLENVPKVRDANALQRSIKYKTSRLKTKIQTKINKKVDAMHNAINNSLSTLKSKSAPVIDTSSNSNSNGDSTVSGGVAGEDNADSDDKVTSGGVAEESLIRLYNKASVMSECDRILNNYNNLSKRFNIDKLFSNIYNEDAIPQSIEELCSFIDTYNLPFSEKYNIAIETAFYGLNKAYIKYPAESIIENVTNYFIINRTMDDNDIHDIQTVAEDSVIFNEESFEPVSYLYTEEVIEDDIDDKTMLRESVEQYGMEWEPLTESDLIKNAKTTKKKIDKKKKEAKSETKSWFKDVKKGNPNEHDNDDVRQMADEFKKNLAKADKDGKDDSKLGNMLTTLTKKVVALRTPENVIDDIPSVFSMFTASVLVSIIAMSVVAGALTILVGGLIRLKLSKEQYDRVIKEYQKEIDKVEKKSYTVKSDKTRNRLERYQKQLESDLEKFKDNSVWEEEEDDDDYYDFDESSMYENAGIAVLISDLVESVSNTDIDSIIENNISLLNDDVIDTITDFSIVLPSMLDRSRLKHTIESYRQDIRESNPQLTDLIKIDTLNRNIYKLKEAVDTYNINTDAHCIIAGLMCMNEIATMNNQQCLNELSLTNSLKVASKRLKNMASKMSTKEKQLSNNIDTAVGNVSKGIEDSMVATSKEAIIKGRILPSASKCIKLAIAGGVAWAVSPAIAVIGAVGTFACQKKLSAKERQLALDDIEIELKMCERYLRQAEDKNDMDAVRQIEIIQRNLQRQQQRIKYKMKMVYNQNVPDVPSNND